MSSSLPPILLDDQYQGWVGLANGYGGAFDTTLHTPCQLYNFRRTRDTYVLCINYLKLTT